MTTDYHISHQIRIIHLSDLHFGNEHRFIPPQTPGGDYPTEPKFPTLYKSICEDLKTGPWAHGKERISSDKESLIWVISGDVTQSCAPEEFIQFKEFIEQLSFPIGGFYESQGTIFITPGNHDVLYKEKDRERRMQPFASLYQSFRSTMISAGDSTALQRIIYNKEQALIVAEINTSAFVEKGAADEKRGRIDLNSIRKLNEQLKKIPKDELSSCLRIAVMHHHPVVLPGLVEAGRGYDAVVNAQDLLVVLRNYGFHLILHGHKHLPQTFLYSPRCAWEVGPAQPVMTIVAGGSAGSVDLPKDHRLPSNTYNLITLTWHPVSQLGRVRIETRGLKIHDNNNRKLMPAYWLWERLSVTDHILAPELPDFNPVMVSQESDQENVGRTNEYARLRGNMPVFNIVPSLIAGQGFEARLCLVPHFSKNSPQREIPKQVVWYAGTHFRNSKQCKPDTNPNLSAFFHYWGPMLVECKMTFDDNKEESAFIYAYQPQQLL